MPSDRELPLEPLMDREQCPKCGGCMVWAVTVGRVVCDCCFHSAPMREADDD